MSSTTASTSSTGKATNAEQLRRALGFAPADYVIGLSAVLRPEKNAVQLIDAVSRLRARGIPARALFIGDGPERARVEARAARSASPTAS